MRFWPIMFVSTLIAALSAQSIDSAKQVYRDSQNAVFLIYLNGADGNPQALGSAFLVAPRMLVTNAHVANAGSPVLAVGPVRIPLKVIRTDEKNDLAILSVDADLTSKPLSLAVEAVDTGEEIFAIGNPEGLEKTFSQGIVSGIRNYQGRELIQITTPISHGSSGGPILNSKGQVIGVAVGMLEGGQNLNFAVPIVLVKELMADGHSDARQLNASDALNRLVEIESEMSNEDYSDDESSSYQKHLHQKTEIASTLASTSNSTELLNRVTCLGTNDFDLSETATVAARRLFQLSPTGDHRALLAYALLQRSKLEQLRSLFMDDGAEKDAAVASTKNLREQATKEASKSTVGEKTKTMLLADYVIASSEDDSGDNTSAVPFHTAVANGGLHVCDSDLAERSIRSLISDYQTMKKLDEAEKWFGRLAAQYQPSANDWDSEGDRQHSMRSFSKAADAYEKAAQAENGYGYDYCYAANDRFMQNNADDVLADGKRCIEASTSNTVKSDQRHFDNTLPLVYQYMAGTLQGRGVYDQALAYINESLRRSPDNSFSMITKAEILDGLERYSECISAAQAAIRLSDGKYGWMHFDLGNCYFAQSDWTHAEASFRIAAESDKTNAAAAFNLALSLSRQGYSSDARTWFREALNRNPDSELRSKIVNVLQ